MKLWLALIAIGSLLGSSAASAVVLTDATGGSQPFSQYQPSLVLRPIVAIQGVFPSPGNNSAPALNHMGMVRITASQNAYSAPAQGQLLPINQNQALFSLYDTNYGGNGTVNFALPNLVGRTVIGTGSSDLGTFSAGDVLGSATTTLTTAQMPAHDHAIAGESFRTSTTGGSQPFSNYQPSLTMNYIIALNNGPTSNDPFAGQVSLYAGSAIPSGWLAAQGQILPIAQFSTLYNLIGTTYGGDGINTFALPDFRGRTAIGASDDIPAGTMIGDPSVILSGAQMPTHDHNAAGFDVLPAGGSQPFDNMQPSLALYFLIRDEGIFPTSDAIVGEFSFISEIVMSASATIPTGWLRAEGQMLAISQHDALFTLIGTTYGGDGINTFALPDMRGLAMMGSGSTFTLGEILGERMTTLTVANLPTHIHSIDAPAVPEPGSWMMMLIGFGLTGFALRRRRLPVAA